MVLDGLGQRGKQYDRSPPVQAYSQMGSSAFSSLFPRFILVRPAPRGPAFPSPSDPGAPYRATASPMLSSTTYFSFTGMPVSVSRALAYSFSWVSCFMAASRGKTSLGT